MSNYDTETILNELKTIEFIWVGKSIHRWWFGDIIGWNVFASSIIRKKYTLERLEQEIKEKNLPLVIKDEPNMSNAFQVLLNDAA